MDITVRRNRNLAIVGESGCGKTTLGRILAGIIEPSEGSIEIEGKELGKLERRELAKVVQPVFQDPYSSLNPQKKVRRIISKPLEIHGMPHAPEVLAGLLEEVGLTPGHDFLDRYPHELSGGQRQRVAIARALALRPRIIVADEPFTGLDPTLQVQVINLMTSLQTKFNVTYVLISHDLSVVRSLCQEAIVVYLGKVVEYGRVEDIMNSPAHPYTSSLLASFPAGTPEERNWIDDPPLTGDVPSAIDIPSGCRFHPRCPYAVESCRSVEPDLLDFGRGHLAACPVMWEKKSVPAN